MRDYRGTENEDHFPYGRPSGSAWIAAAAVAFAFFVLGGFIKTYRQLEAVREESRREIRELRQVVDGLRSSGMDSPRPAASRLPRLPQAIRQTASRPVEPLPIRRAPLPDELQSAVAPSRPHLPPGLDEERPGITYEFGRKSSPDPREALRREHLQVVSVAGPQKRLIVEGGRDIGLREGSRIELSRGGRWIGDLRVVDAYDTMSACEVLHATLPPQPGDLIRVP